MINRILNSLLVAAMVAVLVAFEMKLMAPGDAFFIAVAVIVVFTGQQLIAREQMGLTEAATSMLRPTSWRSRSSLAAYVVCLAIGAFVTVQALGFA